MLTNAQVKAARPKARVQKLSDGEGLYLAVMPPPSNRKIWRCRARHAGQDLTLTLGDWPTHQLPAARAWRAEVRDRVVRGLDPRIAPAGETVEAIARLWHDRERRDWTEIHAADVLAIFGRHVFPAIGGRPIAAIGTADVLELLEAAAVRAPSTARRLRQWLSGVFRYAKVRGLVDADPAEEVADELAAARPPRRQPALVDLDEVRALLARSAELHAGAGVQLASRFLALTGVRLAALRGARWGEIEDLDGDLPTWRVPAVRMKLSAAKKRDATNDHLVPLSKQAVTVLRAVKLSRESLTDDDLIFTGRRAGAAIGEAAIGDLYDRAGYAGRHVPHGWRASFSTICNERRVAGRGEIDRALGHVGGGAAAAEEKINVKVEGAYNRSVHLPERRALMQAWADLLIGRPD